MTPAPAIDEIERSLAPSVVATTAERARWINGIFWVAVFSAVYVYDHRIVRFFGAWNDIALTVAALAACGLPAAIYGLHRRIKNFLLRRAWRQHRG